MSFVDKICTKIGLMDPVDHEEEKRLEDEEARLDEIERRDREEQAEQREREREKRLREMEGPRNVVNLHPSQAGAGKNNVVQAKMRVIVIEPKSFDDAQQVANNLREKKPVVINFENTEENAAKRIIDFISGTTYALEGDIKKVGHNVFLCAPSNVNVTYTEEERKVSTEMPWLGGTDKK
ncbi:MAG: cell division protein SepF [Selenomonadaceae bacterium]|nr:cell division protein SepF [Selenomonadaceae bacterium]